MIKKHVKIKLASPKRILKWTERSLPNGEMVGRINKTKRIITKKQMLNLVIIIIVKMKEETK